MSIDSSRRTFVQGGAALAGVALAAASSRYADAQTPNSPSTGAKPMSFSVKPLPLDPKKIKGLSEKLLVSHYENNYTGAVKRLNAITEQLAGLDYAKAPGFVINGLKREELIAANSMILHELYFAGLGDESRPGPYLPKRSRATSAVRAMARRIRRDGEGPGRWIRVGVIDLEPSRQAPDQRLGR